MDTWTDLDYSALGWVKNELDTTLQQAAEALESYAEDPGDRTQLQFCVTSLHQVHGILQILELYGAAMLAEEMGQLGRALLEERDSDHDMANEVLMRAILQLQIVLERVESGHQDAAILLLPLTNELRAVRGASIIAESALFAVDLDLLPEQPRWPRDGVGRLSATAREIRPLYQRGLLAYLREQNPGEGLKQMHEALLAMDQAGPDDASSTLWWLATGLIDALMGGELNEHAAVMRRLLCQVEHQLKDTLEGGAGGAATEELLRGLLYYLAHAQPVTERIAAIQSLYGLPDLIEQENRIERSRERLFGPSSDALDYVAQAIREELAHVKDTLDLHARGSVRDTEKLTTTAESMTRIADTLGVIGLADARSIVQETAEQVRALVGSEAVDERRTMQVAEALLYVESSLANLVDARREPPSQETAGAAATRSSFGESEYRQVLAHAISEAVTELGYIKESIVQFIESGDQQRLHGLEDRFDAVRGSLALMELERVPELVAATDRFLREHVLSTGEIPAPSVLDDLADAIAGIEYYLEALRDGRRRSEQSLDLTENRLRRLGCMSTLPESTPEEPGPEQSPSPVEEAFAAQASMSDAAQPAPLPDTGIDFTKKRGRVDLEVPVWAESVDPEILEIFLEEAEEVLATLGKVFPRWQRDCDDQEALLTTRRMFHTLKGSGRLAGALLLGELAWSVENLLNRILDRTLEPSSQVYASVAEAIRVIPELVAELRDGTSPSADIRQIMSQVVKLSDPAQHVELAQHSEQALAGSKDFLGNGDRAVAQEKEELPEASTASKAPEESLQEAQVEDEAFLAADSLSTCVAEALAGASGEEELSPPMDPILYEIFSKETEDHLASIESYLTEHRNPVSGQCRVTEGLIRSLHTLTGSARMAEVAPIAQVGRKLEDLLSSRHMESRQLDDSDQDVLRQGAQIIRAVVDELGREEAVLPDVSALLCDIEARQATRSQAVADGGERDASESEPPLREESPCTKEIASSAQQLQEPSPVSAAALDTGDDSACTGTWTASGKASAEDGELVQIFLEEADDILHFLEGAIERWEESPDDDAPVAELHRSLHTLKGGARLAGFEGIGHLCHALESMIVAVCDNRVPADDTFFDLLQTSLDRLTDLLEQARTGALPAKPEGLVARIEELCGTTDHESHSVGDPDRELVEVFLQEAGDILGNTETLLYGWRQQPDALTGVAELQRALHTLKGGARMAGFKPIADLSHSLETLVKAAEEGEVAADDVLLNVLERANDHLVSLREAAVNAAPLPSVGELLVTISRMQAGDGAGAVQPTPVPAGRAASVADETEQADVSAGRRQADLVRVQSQLLDSLVNFAGEVSIYRSRLEQQAGDIGFHLAELGQTVTRLREQLRTLEIETETQILYRFEREHGTAEEADFDPLELDRFSHIQELSRALSESVNDLTNIQGMLDNLNRESETLLLQQARVNTELQDGLMRTRMVPFANLVPRMRRVVRQACEELGKQAQLKVVGAQGEMDRTLLERLIPPLEHMLRNAVAHGIEEPSVRLGIGKAEVGTICVEMEREGTDVAIRVSDDGAGMNLEAIRAKAISRGLMSEGSILSDKEIMQFVLEPGFSTAEKVTQIAGRGVGLDVVNAEIKQLGRSLEIDSKPGSGTKFIARMPFTLALNQALLCQAGDEAYAIPLSSIEGVVRVSWDELLGSNEDRPDSGTYSYAGERYEIRSLADMVGMGDTQPLASRPRVPLILVQAGDHRIALQVDSLLGRREIVVKSTGLQISSVAGVLGATILADGRVVFILDVGALVRYDITAGDETERDERPVLAAHTARRHPLIMVVDDSITMRKVATRLLQRNEIDVITAKDGVDALAALQDHVPDAMLLDIEMPRMDGYELATHMRNDERLRAVPIIVITSRTGDKHRLKAKEIGVDHYLGKPYQESELLAALRELLPQTSRIS